MSIDHGDSQHSLVDETRLQDDNVGLGVSRGVVCLLAGLKKRTRQYLLEFFK